MDEKDKKKITDHIDALRVEEKSVREVMHDAMVPYSEYVIMERALPRIEDGLKPVQRRILYTMSELKLMPDTPYKKCARIVGDCLGKFHPHGDTSVYDALVRLAQDFNMNEPLVDGHGNFGSVDGDSAAAMRYTEARLAPLSLELLRDIDKDTVKFKLNFDDTLKEPETLPGRFPNLLVNGCNGIAIGISTSIPPHNLNEVIDGVSAMIDNPRISLNDMLKIIKAPDFPTGGIIAPGEALRQAYETGKGSVTVFAKLQIEKDGPDKQNIVITELPYQVEKASLLVRIASLVDEKKFGLDTISDIVDESDRNGMRAVIKLKKGVNAKDVIPILLKRTDLQKNISITMMVIADKKPRQMPLLDILKSYIEIQRKLIVDRSRFELVQAKERKEILEGQMIAIQNIDEVVRIIKKSKNVTEAKSNLRQRFGLTEKQANNIVEMKLRRLTNLETDEIIEEIKRLNDTIATLELILSSKQKQLTVVKKEMAEIGRKYKTARRSAIVECGETSDIMDAPLFVEDKTVEPKQVKVSGAIYANKNVVKFITSRSYSQRAKSFASPGVNDLGTMFVPATSDDTVYFFTDQGNVLKLAVSKLLPECSLKDKGKTLLALTEDAKKEEKIVAVVVQTPIDFPEMKSFVFFTKKGNVKLSSVEQYQLSKKYFQGIKLAEGDELIGVECMDSDANLNMYFVTRKGMCLNASFATVPVHGRIAAGVRGITLESDDVIGAGLAKVTDEIAFCSFDGFAKKIPLLGINQYQRAAKGIKVFDTSGQDSFLVFAGKCNALTSNYIISTTELGTMLISPMQIMTTGREGKGGQLLLNPMDRINGISQIEL